jgi:hypothetical protein
MCRFLPLLALLSLAFAPVPLPKVRPGTPSDDLKAMQGTWYRTSLISNGTEHETSQEETRIVIDVIGNSNSVIFSVAVFGSRLEGCASRRPYP